MFSLSPPAYGPKVKKKYLYWNRGTLKYCKEWWSHIKLRVKDRRFIYTQEDTRHRGYSLLFILSVKCHICLV